MKLEIDWGNDSWLIFMGILFYKGIISKQLDEFKANHGFSYHG